MRKLFLAACTTAICFSHAAAQEAHKRDIFGGYSDQKGQTCLTLDYGDTAKIWNLTDGKLVAMISTKSADWSTKLLRYKINHPDYTQSGQAWDWPDEEARNGQTPTRLKINGELVAMLYVAPEYYTFNRASGKLVSYEMKNDQTSIYTHTIPPAGNADKTTTAKPLTKVPGYSDVTFSPKGTWLYQPKAFRLIHPETGATMTIAGVKRGEYQNALFAFNPDETQLSVATEEGIAVVDAATAKVLRKVRLPKNIRDKASTIYPMSDMQSLLYTGSLTTKIKQAFLVKENEVMQLHD